jgi:hypothetical protein
MTPHVIAHGIVSSVEERRNELGGATFRLVRLDTLGGVFDVCLAPGSLEREELLAPGAVARATLWLVGRPITLRTSQVRFRPSRDAASCVACSADKSLRRSVLP